MFAAGEFVGAVVEAALNVEQAGEVVEEGGVEGFAVIGDGVGELDVVVGGDGGEQVEALEDEADLERRSLVRWRR